MELAIDDDDTEPGRCGCSACLRHAEAMAAARRAGVVFVTTYERLAGCSEPFSVVLSMGTGAASSFVGRGETREAAMLAALHEAGFA